MSEEKISREVKNFSVIVKCKNTGTLIRKLNYASDEYRAAMAYHNLVSNRYKKSFVSNFVVNYNKIYNKGEI